MARRQIGQESFRFGAKVERKTSLDELHALIDWAIAQEPLAALYKSPKGEKAWPPLAMFKALLLATWHNLSDVALAEALSDRASFRRFLPAAKQRPSAPRLSAFGASSSPAASIAASFRQSRAILNRRAPLSAKARSSTRR